jgi:hypothetical protein
MRMQPPPSFLASPNPHPLAVRDPPTPFPGLCASYLPACPFRSHAPQLGHSEQSTCALLQISRLLTSSHQALPSLMSVSTRYILIHYVRFAPTSPHLPHIFGSLSSCYQNPLPDPLPTRRETLPHLTYPQVRAPFSLSAHSAGKSPDTTSDSLHKIASDVRFAPSYPDIMDTFAPTHIAKIAVDCHLCQSYRAPPPGHSGQAVTTTTHPRPKRSGRTVLRPWGGRFTSG